MRLSFTVSLGMNPVIIITITITIIVFCLGLRLLEHGSLLERDGYLVAREDRATIGRCRAQLSLVLGAQGRRGMVESKANEFSAG